MTDPLARFDRDIELAALLRVMPRSKLATALTRLIGAHWQLTDADGVVALGPGVAAGVAVIATPLRIDIEIIGHLQASDVMCEPVEAAAAWLDMLLASAYRYRMASDLHLEAVHADYEALQRKHAALQESEARYRELSGQLEQRVKAQVEVIERTQRHLYQAEKMASVGSLAAGMAHEINNPIGFMRSNLSTAAGYVEKMHRTLDAFHRGELDEGQALWRTLDIDFVMDDFSGLLAESVSGADRIARIVANLKAYASIDCTDTVPLDLNDTVRMVADVVRGQLPENITLDIDTQPLPRIVCDQSRMNQVLFSLVQNARQALDAGGLIRIASRAAGNEIRISVSDDGCGIAPNIQDRIFDPFFTTHDVGKGMGLGLTVSRDIVNAHGGRIEVDTAVGRGSIFTIWMPVAAERNDLPESTA
ncbi:MAG TPA: ATP-binding protein [Burkholderiaceae bacterium]|nr:ATP-binding protein [Burkholderiaceae bacterium]